jgi:hypothetical protein
VIAVEQVPERGHHEHAVAPFGRVSPDRVVAEADEALRVRPRAPRTPGAEREHERDGEQSGEQRDGAQPASSVSGPTPSRAARAATAARLGPPG